MVLRALAPQHAFFRTHERPMCAKRHTFVNPLVLHVDTISYMQAHFDTYLLTAAAQVAGAGHMTIAGLTSR